MECQDALVRPKEKLTDFQGCPTLARSHQVPVALWLVSSYPTRRFAPIPAHALPKWCHGFLAQAKLQKAFARSIQYLFRVSSRLPLRYPLLYVLWQGEVSSYSAAQAASIAFDNP